MRSLWRVAAVALLAIVFEQNAFAAEIKMLAVPGMRAAFDELVPQFERSAGHKVAIRYEIFARQKAEIEGEFDVAVFARSAIDELAKRGKIAPASTSDLVRTSIGVAVRKGAPKPDISSEDAFKRTLLAAKSITYTKESATGVHVTQLLERLGLTEAIKEKMKLQPGGGMTTPAGSQMEKLKWQLCSSVTFWRRPVSISSVHYPRACRIL
jgi:molybdate transport system substrate-binding protein